MKNIYLIIGAIVLFSLGYGASQAWGKTVIIRPKVLRESGYKYTSPVLLCNSSPNQPYNEDKTLSDMFISKNQKTLQSDISAYYLNLSNGEWASVNENETYSPASMLKVPTVAQVLKYAEENPSVNQKQILYNGSFDNNKAESFPPVKHITAGNYYNVDELISYTIVNSDNNALSLLRQNLDQNLSSKLYSELGIDIPQNSVDFMSAKTYSLFLRVLYNATYLSPDDSEKVLGLMIQSDFPQGLKAGLPANIEVAHKFGEREVLRADGSLVDRELHDCGIIYAPNNKYILCVMTRGQDWKVLAQSIAEVSRLVYSHVVK